MVMVSLVFFSIFVHDCATKYPHSIKFLPSSRIPSSLTCIEAIGLIFSHLAKFHGTDSFKFPSKQKTPLITQVDKSCQEMNFDSAVVLTPCFLVWRGVSEIHTSGTSHFGGADAKSTPRSEGSPALQTLSGVLRQDSFRQETVIDLYRGLYNTVMS